MALNIELARLHLSRPLLRRATQFARVLRLRSRSRVYAFCASAAPDWRVQIHPTVAPALPACFVSRRSRPRALLPLATRAVRRLPNLKEHPWVFSWLERCKPTVVPGAHNSWPGVSICRLPRPVGSGTLMTVFSRGHQLYTTALFREFPLFSLGERRKMASMIF